MSEGRVSRQEWARRVRGWRASGQTCEAYATRLGCNVRSLRWWAWQLGRKPGEGVRLVRLTEASDKAVAERAVEPAQEAAQAAKAVPSAVEVVVGGARIRVESGFDSALLRAVVSALEAGR